MTEESNDEKDYMVRVTAQVMTRDDSKGGWVTMEGGGLSIVHLRKLLVSNHGDDKHEFLINGHRCKDDAVVLNCVLKKDVKYTKANPTFYHWTTEDKRFGLTFQTSADAKAFDRAVKRAIDELLEGNSEFNKTEAGEDDVFMSLDLPLGRKDSSSQSASTTSTTTSSPAPNSPNRTTDPFNYNHPSNHQHLHRVHYISRPPRRSQSIPSSNTSSDKSIESCRDTDVWVKDHSILRATKSDQGHLEGEEGVELLPVRDSSYVMFQKPKRTSLPHEYQYPMLDTVKPQQKRDSNASSYNKKYRDVITHQPPLPQKNSLSRYSSKHLLSERARCVYCNEMFIRDDNPRGRCQDAPDKGNEFVETISCMKCARCILYHCVSDADGDYGHPCACDSQEEQNCKKWTTLSILSLFCPCLWCYVPLKSCHGCGKQCGCCGGRHKATSKS